MNQCVSELSLSVDQVRRSNSSAKQTTVPISNLDKSRRNTDPSNFVTVIEVNGLKTNKSNETGKNNKKKIPPR